MVRMCRKRWISLSRADKTAGITRWAPASRKVLAATTYKGSHLMKSLLRPTLAAALLTAATFTPAFAEVEVGGTAGVHVFSKTSELGVNDVASADSERNSALFGFRLGVFF